MTTSGPCPASDKCIRRPWVSMKRCLISTSFLRTEQRACCARYRPVRIALDHWFPLENDALINTFEVESSIHASPAQTAYRVTPASGARVRPGERGARELRDG